MAILALPLVISALKPHHSSRLFLLRSAPTSRLLRHFSNTSVSAISTTSALPHQSSTAPIPEASNKAAVLTFQQAIQRLQEYWASVGCAIMQCSNTEVGAGTMNPLTFLRVLGPEPWNAAYAEPSIRPDDSRYGENPNRLQRHTQFQVILKPDPGNSQNLFICSLSALGIDVRSHDIRFVEDNWESPVLGAWGLGWEIWMDGMEITQFTYFQQAGSLQLSPVSVEITYGLERILMLLQGVDHFKKIQYADGITYGELFLENEKEMSAYYLEHAGVHHIQRQYDQLLKTSHAFNILDSRGFVGVTERARYFGRMRRYNNSECKEITINLSQQGWLRRCSILWVTKVHDTARSFGLEIGIEEMPPQDVVDASQQLKDLATQLLAKQRLGHGEVQAFGTPRRLVVCVENLCTKQMENEVEVRGPPVSKSFDDQGNPTKAAEGFCRRYSVPLNSLYQKTDGKTEYIYARVVESARHALEVLSEDLPNAIARISFPKSMRWNSQVLFSRPIRWILALHGDVVVPFTFAQVLSGNLSYGLRNTPSATVTVETAECYAGVIRNAGINIEMEERKKTTRECSSTLARSVNGEAFLPEGLLNEVVNLVEAPVPVLGEFKRSFLELPSDLLTMVMQKHQKYFSVRDENGELLPFFIAVANGVIDEMVVGKGNEAVLRARYEDAKFFYEMDTRKRFSEFRSQLKGIIFHEKLGTMLEKVLRLENMVDRLTLALGMDDSTNKIVQQAASLSMSDLATAVVTEFTSLSGVMARHYALRDGYSEQVAEALFEITLPRFSGDTLPKTDAGIVLSVADRLDSLVGLFAAGCQPSSTNDPFGLRRISYGLVQVLVEKDKYLDLQQALELAADVQPIKVEAPTIKDAHQFVTRRLEQYLVDKGISPGVVRSVLAERANLPCLAARTACKMEALSKGELLPKVIEAYSRPTRIVRGKDVDPHFEVDEAAFETDEERALWISFLSVKEEICHGIEVDEFVKISAQLVQPLDDFFEHVFVMVEDEGIRNNRLALLKKVAELPRGVADLSMLPGF
ncbi:hypothetical protein ACLB2K_073940 [Fragaria x ananassa]